MTINLGNATNPFHAKWIVSNPKRWLSRRTRTHTWKISSWSHPSTRNSVQKDHSIDTKKICIKKASPKYDASSKQAKQKSVEWNRIYLHSRRPLLTCPLNHIFAAFAAAAVLFGSVTSFSVHCMNGNEPKKKNKLEGWCFTFNTALKCNERRKITMRWRSKHKMSLWTTTQRCSSNEIKRKLMANRKKNETRIESERKSEQKRLEHGTTMRTMTTSTTAKLPSSQNRTWTTVARFCVHSPSMILIVVETTLKMHGIRASIARDGCNSRTVNDTIESDRKKKCRATPIEKITTRHKQRAQFDVQMNTM